MNKDTKVLLMAVVIILVALVSFNLSDLTGKAIEGSSITVSPSVLNFGWEQNLKKVYVDFDIGSEAVENRVYLYSKANHRQSVSLKIDRTLSLTSTVSDIQVKDRPLSLSVDLPKGKYYLGATGKDDKVILKSNYITIK